MKLCQTPSTLHSQTRWTKDKLITVSVQKHTKMHCILSQWRTGWRHVFTCHISQAWKHLQGDLQKDKKTQKASDWTAALVTAILQQAIDSWETTNEDLHGESKLEQADKMLNSKKFTISKLIALKDRCPARSHCVFPKT